MILWILFFRSSLLWLFVIGRVTQRNRQLQTCTKQMEKKILKSEHWQFSRLLLRTTFLNNRYPLYQRKITEWWWRAQHQRQVRLAIHWSVDRPTVNSPGAFHINFYDSIPHKKKNPQDPIPFSKEEWLTILHILNNREIYSLHDTITCVPLVRREDSPLWATFMLFNYPHWRAFAFVLLNTH